MLSARFRRAIRRSPLLLVAPAASLTWALPVAAQPYGPPQQVELSVVAGQAQASLRFGGADDVTFLASSLGILGEERSMLDGAVAHQDGDAALLARSPEFATYLKQHLRLSQDGQPCAGTLVVPTGTQVTLVADSVAMTFRCPGTSASVVADIDLLVDLHPAYRTQVSAPDGQQQVFAAEASQHDFDLPGLSTSTQAPAEVRNRTGLVLGVVGAGLLVALGAAIVRLRGRSKSGPGVCAK